jgi:PleD family two-component response regulator
MTTTAGAIDFLGELLGAAAKPERECLQTASILVVDDDEVPRRNIVRALSIVKLNAVSTGSPEQARHLLAENRFDLIFLDVEMPGMTGFELCSWLRKRKHHAKTPVDFVTGLSQIEAKLRAMVSGGNEFIAKPFLPIELATKALRHLMRHML